jgi:hypothetical protein
VIVSIWVILRSPLFIVILNNLPWSMTIVKSIVKLFLRAIECVAYDGVRVAGRPLHRYRPICAQGC